MEIKFNPSQATTPSESQKVARPKSAGTARQNEALDNVDALQQRLNEVPLVRSEKVAAAKEKVSDLKYPPDELLNGIANLLALHIK